MRSKSRRGGRSRPRPVASTAASTPSSMVSPSAPDRDVQKQDVVNEIDVFRKDSCIRCDESGDLLVCSEISCPIALHGYCMSCDPTFDEEGRFYCPYCSYKRALVRVNELRRKAMGAKRALSDFIDTRMVDGGDSSQKGDAHKKKATCGVDASLPNPNHGSHLGNENLRDQDMQVEQNHSNEGEDNERTAGDVQSLVGVNHENHDGPIVSNVDNNIHSILEVQPREDSMNEEETRGADTYGTHQVECLEDEKTMEEENLRSADDIQNDGVVKDHAQPETPSAHHDEEEIAMDVVDHEAEREPQGKGDGGESVQLETIDVGSENNDLKNKPIVKKKRFKSRANRKIDLQNFESFEDGNLMEEENVRLTDDIQNEGIVKDQAQPETPSAHHDEEEIAIDVVDHEAEREPQDKGDGGEPVHLENIDVGSENNDLKNKPIVKKKRFKSRANRKIDLQNFESFEDGKTMEEENLSLTDDIQNEGVVKDQGQPETPSEHHDEEEIAIDVVDHEAEREPQDKDDGGETVQLENINGGPENNDLKNKLIVKKKRFKARANRKIDIQNFNSPRKSPRTITPESEKKSTHMQSPEPNHIIKIEKTSASKNLKQQEVSTNRFKNLEFHGGKRKRLRWSTEEEEMLKAGVQKFSTTANKNLPWRKILEFGRHVFDETRTPVDLKDKWRNILAK